MSKLTELIKAYESGWKAVTRNGEVKQVTSKLYVGQWSARIKQDLNSRLKFNDLTMLAEIDGQPIKGEELENIYIELNERGWDISDKDAKKGFLNAAKVNRYHPVEDYLTRIENDPNVVAADIDKDFDLPPLTQSFYLNGIGNLVDSLAIFESGWPLWLRNENKNIRTTILSTSELSLLYHFTDKKTNNNIFSTILNDEVNWLLKTGGSNENYFRLNKNYFQQGEMIYVTGNQPFKTSFYSKEMLLKVFNNNKNLFSTVIDFNLEKDRWEGKFRALNPGEYSFKVFSDNVENPIQIGKFNVLESQIELSTVYLNQQLLSEISQKTKGEYFHWENRKKMIDSIEPKFRKSFKADIIKLTQSRLLLLLIILIFLVEWTIRIKNGLI